MRRTLTADEWVLIAIGILVVLGALGAVLLRVSPDMVESATQGLVVS